MFSWLMLSIWWIVTDMLIDNVLLWAVVLLIGNITILLIIGQLPYKKIRIFNIRMKL